jgi:CHAT domain-containing protein/Flp pilus assembly protein TadD
MMRCSVALAALAIVACRETITPEEHIKQAEDWLHTEQFAAVQSHVDSWLAAAAATRDPTALWRLRLIKTEAMLGQQTSPDMVVTLLRGWGGMPDTGVLKSQRPRWLILQARAMYSLSRSAEAKDWLDRADIAAQSAGRADLSAEIELRRAFLSMDENKYSEAHHEFDEVLAEAHRLRDRYLEARVENAIGLLLIDESRHDEAIPVLERSRELALEIGASDTAARTEGNLGFCYYRLGDYERARDRIVQAEAEFLRNGNLFEVQAWTGNAGNVSYSTGDLAAAMASYKAALRTARQLNSRVWVGRWLNNLATVAIDRGDWDAAEQYNDEARKLKAEMNDAGYEASSLLNAAQIAAGRGNPDEARTLFQSALGKDSEDPTVVLEAHAGLAQLYSQRGKQAAAEAEFRGTIDEIDRRQSRLFKDDYRLSWLDSLISFYQKYVEFLMAQNQPERALEAADASRSKVLTSQPIPRLTAAEYRQLAQRSHAVLLEYWLGPKQSYLWVITPSRIYCHTLPAEAEIRSLIRTYRAVVSGGRNPLMVADTTGRSLYTILLAPAVADAGGNADFIVVPDDELYSLNLETLPDGLHDDRFWIESATIRISPSLNYIASNAPLRGKPRNSRLLLIGDPDPALSQYPKLEFASTEISEIASAMSAAQPVVVKGASATPASYSASQPADFGFIHFSAHAAAAALRESALDSSVILSGPPDKCRLMARDVAQIHLNAELVTVSACRSAGSRTYAGEGLVGFAWAFMKAGAKNVIAGLWDVNDQSTVRLMSGLYSGLAKGQREADALRSAKLALIHGGGSYAKPFYWAPFELYTARAE